MKYLLLILFPFVANCQNLDSVKVQVSVAGQPRAYYNVDLNRKTIQKIDSIKNDISGKVDKISGKALSTNDYDNTEKSALARKIEPNDITMSSDSIRLNIKNKVIKIVAANVDLSSYQTSSSIANNYQPKGDYPTNTQLAALLATKQNTISVGQITDYIRGDLTVAAFPTIPIDNSQLANGMNYVNYDQLSTKVNIADTAQMLSSYLAATFANTSKEKTDSAYLKGLITTNANALAGKLDTSGVYLNSIVKNNSGLLYKTTTTALITGRTATITDTLLTQLPYTVLGNSTSSTANPTFSKIPVQSINATGSGYDGTKTLYDDGTWKSAGAAIVTSVNDSVLRNAGVSRQVLFSNVQLPNTVSSTTENTVFMGTIPANTISANGSFQFNMLVSSTSNANAKTFRIKFNGTTVGTMVPSSVAAQQGTGMITNRNSTTSQVGMTSTSTASMSFTGSSSFTSFSFNTSAAITVTITIQNGVSTDVSAVERFNIIAIN